MTDYYGPPFYPGRVFLDTNDGTRVWAYLRRIKSDHKKMREVHYDDNRERDEKGHTYLRSLGSCHGVALSQMMCVLLVLQLGRSD